MSCPLVRLVDDDAIFRETYAEMLRLEGYETALWADAESFLADFANGAAVRSGCLVLDVRLPGMSGPELFDELDRLGCTLPVILLTGHADVRTAVRTLKSGAVDFLEKDCDPEHFLEVVEAACAADAQAAEHSRSLRQKQQIYEQLTPREKTVLKLSAEGLQIKEAAKVLGLSPETVKMHRTHAFGKIGAKTALDAYRWLEAVDPSVRADCPVNRSGSSS